jgi:DNA repair protein SbcD/Mre11
MSSRHEEGVRILHFADAHIDMANYGRHDPESGLPVRVVDFLRSLDTIVDTAVDQAVDLVIFAGDAYKDRNPQPTFQRAWGQRMMRLSRAGIATLLLVGNHDVSPAAGRAHTVQEYSTLDVPNIHVADRIRLWGPDELGCQVQVIAIPWISRSALMTREEMAGRPQDEIVNIIAEHLSEGIERLLSSADPGLPLILAAHASVHGARYGSERAVMLGNELVLTGSVVQDNRLDYVALGHIHRHQSLNDDRQPPVVYAGSIERIDFGEAREDKGFVLAQVRRGQTEWQFVTLRTRPFIDLRVEPQSAEDFMADILGRLPAAEDVAGAICRLRLHYPHDWEPLLDEAAISERFRDALGFHIQKHRQFGERSRLGDTFQVESLGPIELLEQYWLTVGLEPGEATVMQALAQDILLSPQDE